MPRAAPQSMITALLWDFVLIATIPVALFFFAKRYVSPSELVALLWATSFPLLKSAYSPGLPSSCSGGPGHRSVLDRARHGRHNRLDVLVRIQDSDPD